MGNNLIEISPNITVSRTINYPSIGHIKYELEVNVLWIYNNVRARQ